MNFVYLNGEYIPVGQAKISVLDRGFLFGDGVYENIPAYFGKPFRLKEHIKRLGKSLAAILLSTDIKEQQWIEIVNELLAKNQVGKSHQKIYIQITRGPQPVRDHRIPASHIKPTVFMMLSPLVIHDYEQISSGYKVITREDIRWAYNYIKSISLLSGVLLYEEAKQNHAEDVILVRNGYAIEGSTSNLFIVKDGVIITPPENQYMLSGITRDLVLELAKKHTLSYQEHPIKKEELTAADEVWISSSSRDIMPITQVDDTIITDNKPGKHWRKMLRLIQEYRK